MSKKPEISTSWLNDSDKLYKDIVEKIVEGLTGNPFFTALNPPIKTVEDQYLLYKVLVLPRGQVTTLSSEQRVIERDKLTELLKKVFISVTAIAEYDLIKLQSTNIPLINVPKSAPAPQVPTKIKFGMHGSPPILRVSCAAQLNASLYKARISENMVDWKWSEQSSSASMEFKDLPRGKELYVQMCMKNVNGASDWSTPIPIMIPGEGVTIPSIVKPRKLKT